MTNDYIVELFATLEKLESIKRGIVNELRQANKEYSAEKGYKVPLRFEAFKRSVLSEQ